MKKNIDDLNRPQLDLFAQKTSVSQTNKAPIIRQNLSVRLAEIDFKFGDLLSNSDKISDLIEMQVTEFVLANKCPLLYDHFNKQKTVTQSSKHYPWHPLYYRLGYCLDQAARKFFSYEPEIRTEIFDNLVDKLNEDLIEIFLEIYKPKIHKTELFRIPVFKNYKHLLISSFEAFCRNFWHSRKVDSDLTTRSLFIKIGNLQIRGKVDLVLTFPNNRTILLELKLQRFGVTEDLHFPDIMQVLIYAIKLIQAGFKLDEVGYYYFMDKLLISEKINKLPIEKIFDALEKLANNLVCTRKFIPKKCELCLICPLKKECEVGKTVSLRSFKYPLL